MASSRPAMEFPAPSGGSVDLLIIAGEHSGDQHAARMVQDLLRRRPDLHIAALGGPELSKAGIQLLFDLTDSSVVGLVEVVRNLPFFRDVFNATLSWIAEYKPRAVCFVDYPGLNLRVARALFEKRLSRKGGGTIATLYYISPQIWAWKAGRRFKMAEHLDSMAVIFPFERQSYADTALPVHFVGHPFVDPDYVAPVAYDEGGPVLLLPGSRRQAVRRIFPLMLAGFAEFAERKAVVLCPSAEVEEVLRAARPPANVEIRRLAEGAERDRPLGAAAVLTSSGTMSMHCALAAIPGAVVYRANPLTYLLGRWLVKIPYIGIANLLLQSPMYPEYIQGAAQPKVLARELQDCIHNPDRRRRTAEQSTRLRQILGEQTTGDAADWVLQNLG